MQLRNTQGVSAAIFSVCTLSPSTEAAAATDGSAGPSILVHQVLILTQVLEARTAVLWPFTLENFCQSDRGALNKKTVMATAGESSNHLLPHRWSNCHCVCKEAFIVLYFLLMEACP